MVLTNFNGAGVGFGTISGSLLGYNLNGAGCGFGVGWGFGGTPLNLLGLGVRKAEAVALDWVLDRALALPFVVSMIHLGSHSRA